MRLRRHTRTHNNGGASERARSPLMGKPWLPRNGPRMPLLEGVGVGLSQISDTTAVSRPTSISLPAGHDRDAQRDNDDDPVQ